MVASGARRLGELDEPVVPGYVLGPSLRARLSSLAARCALRGRWFRRTRRTLGSTRDLAVLVPDDRHDGGIPASTDVKPQSCAPPLVPVRAYTATTLAVAERYSGSTDRGDYDGRDNGNGRKCERSGSLPHFRPTLASGEAEDGRRSGEGSWEAASETMARTPMIRPPSPGRVTRGTITQTRTTATAIVIALAMRK